MAAPTKEALEQWEASVGLTDEGLTYQKRVKRMFEMKSMSNEPREAQAASQAVKQGAPELLDITQHPLYGKLLLISPKLTPNKNRAVEYDEIVGHEIIVEEAHAGAMIEGMGENTDRAYGEFNIVHEDKGKPVVAKSHVPKVNTELTFRLLEDELPVPVVRGTDGQTGYLYSWPSTRIRIDEHNEIMLHGLKSIIRHFFPEYISHFSGKPMMSYVDGVTLVASKPLTDNLMLEARRKKAKDAKLGIN